MEQKIRKRASGKKSAFFYEFKEELKKVTWTTKKELIASTKIVLIATFSCGLVVYLLNLLIKGGLDGLKWLFRFLF